jgi:predicted transcriptional regulator
MKKATYRLDSTTLETLNRLARHWEVSKSEAVRRALRQLDERLPISRRKKKTIKDARR